MPTAEYGANIAKQSGLAASRIRFYESASLLQTVARRSNGYRDYPPDALLILRIITSAQNVGFSLDEVRTILPADLSNWQHEVLLGILRRKITDIEAIEARLAKNKAHLIALVGDIQNKPEGMDCKDNAKRLFINAVR